MVSYANDRLKEDIEIRFTYHAPNEDQVDRMTYLRGMAKGVADAIIRCTPESREQSLALTHLEECVMQANAAIVRRENATTTD